MIFYGNAMPTSVRGVGLMGAPMGRPALAGLGAVTTWTKQIGTNKECATSAGAVDITNCRAYVAPGTWVRQSGPRNTLECSRDAKGAVTCRPYGAVGVKGLQTALTALAQTTGNAKFDPKAIDGAMGFNTRLALGEAVNAIGASFSTYVRAVTIPLAVLLHADYKTADDMVVKNADMIAAAISLASVRLAPGGMVLDPNAGSGFLPSAGGPAWYTTQNGKIAIGLGAAAVLLLVLKK